MQGGTAKLKGAHRFFRGPRYCNRYQYLKTRLHFNPCLHCIFLRCWWCLTSCLFPVLDSQPTATELFQSPPFGSGTVFRSTSRPRRHFPSSALAWRHTTSSNCVIHDTFVVPEKWHHHFGHVNRFYLLTYLLCDEGDIPELLILGLISLI